MSLKKDITGHGVKAALMVAMTKFNGQALTVNGSDELKAKCFEVAAREGLKLAFSDPDMERERKKREQAASQASAVKEQNTQEDATQKNGAGEKKHKRLRGSMER